MKNFVVGVDVGGTNVKVGLVNDAGKVISRSAFSTGAYKTSQSALIEAICSAVNELLAQNKISKEKVAGVGLGLPGIIDVDQGLVRILPNIPGWIDVPLRNLMEQSLGLVVALENDVNMITLGEWKHGAGKGFTDLICMTLGTGVGAGLVLGNNIYRGSGFAAGEIGHMPINEDGPACGCGGWGCFEQYVGNRRLQSDAAACFSSPDITLEEVYSQAVEGKQKALLFWEGVGAKVAVGLVGPVNLLNPECVIIGGGVSRSFNFMKPAIERTIKERCMGPQSEKVRFIQAQLDDDAGILGAEVLIHHEIR